MKKLFFLVVVVLLFSFVTTPAYAAKPPLTFLDIWVYPRYGALNWIDAEGRMVVVSGYSPLAGSFSMLAGNSTIRITKMSFKLENKNFVAAVDKLYAITFLEKKDKYNRKTIVPKQHVVTLTADGTAVVSLKNDPIVIARNSTSSINIQFLMKNDAGGAVSGEESTFSLLKDDKNNLIGFDAFIGNKKLNNKYIQNNISTNPVFVLHHAVGKINNACHLLLCNLYPTGPEARIGEFYYSAERQYWENYSIRPKPELKSVRVRLEGGAIGSGIGDNKITLTAHSRNQDYSADIVLGQVTLENADDGQTSEGKIVLNNQFILDNGSKLVWFTVDSTDDDFVPASASLKKLELVATGLGIFDGEATYDSFYQNVKSGPIFFSDTAKNIASKINVNLKLKMVNNVQQAEVTANITSPESSGKIEIFMGNDDSKARLTLYQTCPVTLTEGQASCVFSFPTSNRYGGFYYARFTSDRGLSAESDVNYFNY